MTAQAPHLDVAPPLIAPRPRFRLGSWVMLSLVILFFAVLLLWPIFQVVRVGLFGIPDTPDSGFTLAYIGAIFRDAGLRAGLLNSIFIAVCVTILCMCISVPLAVLSVRYDFFGKKILNSLLLVPLILPPFVGAIGMRQMMGRYGALTSIAHSLGIVDANTPIDWFGAARVAGIILMEALSLYPILLLNASAALANLDPAMEQAAANLGASRWTIFRRITFPLMRPGLFAGGTIVLIWSLTELGTPLMFDYYRVTPVQIFQRISQVGRSPLPFALVVVMLLMSGTLYALGRFFLGRGRDASVTKASVQAQPRKLSPLKSALVFMLFAAIVLLALLPHIGVILTSLSGVGKWYQSVMPEVFTLHHYGVALTHDIAQPSVRNSVLFAFSSMVIDLGLGLLIAWLIVRSKLPGRQLIDTLAMLPLAVPGLVLAFGYLAISLQLQAWFPGSKWVRGAFDVQLNPTILLVIAYAMRRLPYVVRSAVAGLEQTPADLELAAKNLGASSLRTLRKITIPLIAANLIAGGLLAFAFAMLEVSDSLILAQHQHYWPITKAIYELSQRLADGPYVASALGVWAMVFLTLTILAASSFLGKKMGAIFRV